MFIGNPIRICCCCNFFWGVVFNVNILAQVAVLAVPTRSYAAAAAAGVT